MTSKLVKLSATAVVTSIVGTTVAVALAVILTNSNSEFQLEEWKLNRFADNINIVSSRLFI